MAGKVTKLIHKQRIRKRTPIRVTQVKFQNIIEFRYSGKDIYDAKPLVFVLSRIGKVLTGINMSYLKEHSIERLLQEKSFRKLKYWDSLYKHAFRTYKTPQVRQVKLIEWETSDQRRRRKEEERRKKQDDITVSKMKDDIEDKL